MKYSTDGFRVLINHYGMQHICRMLGQKKGLKVRMQLCQSNWHKFLQYFSQDLSQLEFYLEALDQEERRSNENPSIGIILCKDADMEVVRFALNRSMSPTMVALYKEQLQVGSVIQRSLVEFCNFLNKEKKKR